MVKNWPHFRILKKYSSPKVGKNNWGVEEEAQGKEG